MLEYVLMATGAGAALGLGLKTAAPIAKATRYISITALEAVFPHRSITTVNPYDKGNGSARLFNTWIRENPKAVKFTQNKIVWDVHKSTEIVKKNNVNKKVTNKEVVYFPWINNLAVIEWEGTKFALVIQPTTTEIQAQTGFHTRYHLFSAPGKQKNLDAFLTMIMNSEKEESIKAATVYVSNGSDFEEEGKINASPNPELLPDNLKDVLDDVGAFLDREEWYKEFEVAWKRGILLAGPPGTGKSTMVKIIAKKYGLPLYIVDPNSLIQHKAAILKSKKLQFPCIMLFEDIDTLSVVTRAEQDQKGFSDDRDNKEYGGTKGNYFLGQLLNFLDGVSTPQGILFIATTNHIAQLDKALIRPGRFDVVEEVGFLPEHIVLKKYADFYRASNINWQDYQYKGTTSIAELQSTLLKHIDDPKGGAAAVGITSKVAGGHPSVQDLNKLLDL